MSVDIVAVFDDKLNQLFPTARPLKATVREAAKLMEHPIESGSVITDHKIIEPIEITLHVVLTGEEYRDTYKAIHDAFVGENTLTVQTRTSSYDDMLIQEMPHEESPDMLDIVPMIIKLKQVIIITAQSQALPPRKASNPKDYSVVDQGEKNPKPKGSALWRGTYGRGKGGD